MLHSFSKSIPMPRKRRNTSSTEKVVPGQLLKYHPLRNQMPFPPIFETTFWCEADYKVPIATASITTGAVKLNTPWLPFRPGGSSSFPTLTFLGPATESTLLPTGYSSLTSGGLYGQYRVMQSRIKVRWAGSNSGNNVMCVLVPAVNIASIGSIYAARTFPFAKQGSFSVSKPNTGTDKDGWLIHQISPYQILGYNKTQSEADATVNLGSVSADAPIELWWFVFLQSNDQDVSSTTASTLQVRVEYRTQLLSLINAPVTLSGVPKPTGEEKVCPCLVQARK